MNADDYFEDGFKAGLKRAMDIAESHRDAPGKAVMEQHQASWIAEDIWHVLIDWPNNEPSSRKTD
jgi:hypothetical protein